jgi:hypothetical protein
MKKKAGAIPPSFCIYIYSIINLRPLFCIHRFETCFCIVPCITPAADVALVVFPNTLFYNALLDIGLESFEVQ